jgi:hypothetical protein
MRLLLSCLVALLLSGCASRPGCEPRAFVAVPSLPPEPLEELVQAPTTPGQTWVAGYWHWDDTRWVWVPGHWISPPPGRHWVPAATAEGSAGPLYRPGDLGCDDE